MAQKTEKKIKKESDGLVHGFSIKQLIWFILGVLIAVLGLVFLVLGLIEDYADIPNSILTSPNAGMIAALGGIDFKWFGVLAFMLGVLIYALALSFASKNADREKEKEARREQRLKAMRDNNKGVVVNFDGSSSANSEKPL